MTHSHAGYDRGFSPQALGLSTTALVLLRDLILQRTGQYFDNEKLDLLADKVAEIVTANGAPTILDYYYLLKYDDSTAAHWDQLTDKLAVPETYFWRQAEQIDALIQHVVPSHQTLRRGQPLRIWSAACCTGEEPLSIAIALQEAGWFDRLSIEIIGTDLSEAMVERARRGVYGERSMRAIDQRLRDRYFTRKGAGWQIDRSIHARVRWGRANLAAPDELRDLATADVIYCRNVLIYFSDDSIRDVASTFARLMPDSGILFLGASESLLRFSTDFSLIEVGHAFAYTPVTNKDPAPPSSRTGMRDSSSRMSSPKA